MKKFRFIFFVFVNVAWIVSSLSCSPRNIRVTEFPPTIQTLSASTISTDKAVLNLTTGASGFPVEVWFEYGTDPVLSSWTSTPRFASGSVTEPLQFKTPILELNSYTRYYFRAVAANCFGTQRSEIRSFPTGEFYVAVGDSITRNGGKGGYAAVLATLLEKSKGYPNTIANYGVDGATSAVGRKHVSYVLASRPLAKYFLIMYGTNDARLPRPVPSGRGRKPGDPGYAGTYKENMQTIISTIMAAGKVPLVAKAPHTTCPDIDVRSIQEYNAVIDELVAEYKIAVTPPDFFTHFKMSRQELPDGIHPNEAGYTSMAKLWLQVLAK